MKENGPKWTENFALSETSIDKTLLSKDGENVGTFEAITQYRQKRSFSDALYTKPELLSDEYQKHIDFLKKTDPKNEMIERYETPYEKILYVKIIGIEKDSRASGALFALLKDILPELKSKGIAYLVGKYEGFSAQQDYGEDKRVPIIYEKLGTKLEDGTYWIPIEKLEKFLPLAKNIWK